jgi:hypothetical protein
LLECANRAALCKFEVMTTNTAVQVTGVALFALAVLHTFSTRYFQHLAHTRPAHAGVWHLLGEVETAFGFWAFVLVLFMVLSHGWNTSAQYLDTLRFTEPMFVFVIMVIAASRPVMQSATDLVEGLAKVLPLPAGTGVYFLSLFFVPLLGSFITEPAAMTLAALMLRDRIFTAGVSSRLKYATVGVLFVNISVGGTLTNFAAPPVLMVAAKWQWTTGFMLSTFGAKAALAVLINAAAVTFLFHRELAQRARVSVQKPQPRVPLVFVLVNLALLAAVVATNHHPEAFMGLFLLFLGLAEAYKRYHDRLMLREGLMVALFLAGLVVLGGQQQWWLQDVLARLDETTLFYGAAALTAITDNAALTYLGSLVEGVSSDYKYSLVAGAVAGGGLTVIANAPNPAGFAILKDHFEDQAISAVGLLGSALLPTLAAIACFRGIRGPVHEVFDWNVWGAWFGELDRSFILLLILPFVVAVVAFWADYVQRRGNR